MSVTLAALTIVAALHRPATAAASSPAELDCRRAAAQISLVIDVLETHGQRAGDAFELALGRRLLADLDTSLGERSLADADGVIRRSTADALFGSVEHLMDRIDSLERLASSSAPSDSMWFDLRIRAADLCVAVADAMGSNDDEGPVKLSYQVDWNARVVDLVSSRPGGIRSLGEARNVARRLGRCTELFDALEVTGQRQWLEDRIRAAANALLGQPWLTTFRSGASAADVVAGAEIRSRIVQTLRWASPDGEGLAAAVSGLTAGLSEVAGRDEGPERAAVYYQLLRAAADVWELADSLGLRPDSPGWCAALCGLPSYSVDVVSARSLRSNRQPYDELLDEMPSEVVHRLEPAARRHVAIIAAGGTPLRLPDERALGLARTPLLAGEDYLIEIGTADGGTVRVFAECGEGDVGLAVRLPNRIPTSHTVFAGDVVLDDHVALVRDEPWTERELALAIEGGLPDTLTEDRADAQLLADLVGGAEPDDLVTRRDRQELVESRTSARRAARLTSEHVSLLQRVVDPLRGTRLPTSSLAERAKEHHGKALGWIDLEQADLLTKGLVRDGRPVPEGRSFAVRDMILLEQ